MRVSLGMIGRMAKGFLRAIKGSSRGFGGMGGWSGRSDIDLILFSWFFYEFVGMSVFYF